MYRIRKDGHLQEQENKTVSISQRPRFLAKKEKSGLKLKIAADIVAVNAVRFFIV